MDTIRTLLAETWQIVRELSPWLLFGMLLAGILHVLLPAGFIRRHLGGSRLASVLKAVAAGVPLPLCSCGVIPTAIGLRKDGASKGAVTGFLISTPQTGVDSILVSATFLGWPFALFKVVSALVSGCVGGWLVNLTENGISAKQTTSEVHPSAPAGQIACCHAGSNLTDQTAGNCHGPAPAAGRDPTTPVGLRAKAREALSFGLGQLLGDIYKWLLVGILAAGLISTFVPAGRLQEVAWTQGLWGLFAMVVISLPMYICATASVPLAASLVAAGMSSGAALVLLMAGPTTNVATMGAILRSFGKTVLAIYLATVIGMSISLGWLFDWLLLDIPSATEHMHAIPAWLEISAALGLLGLLAYFAGRDLFKWIQRDRTAGPDVSAIPAAAADCPGGHRAGKPAGPDGCCADRNP